MEVIWKITPEDVNKIQSFYKSREDDPFTQNRYKTNVLSTKHVFSKDSFWRSIVSCLLTTQQRSGPESAISRFMRQNPYPLSYDQCLGQDNLKNYSQEALSSFGGIRRAPTLADQIVTNFEWLEQEGWSLMKDLFDDLVKCPGVESERKIAKEIIENLKGFGPKQSRNLLQQCGLTKYEIPLDSRIMKWMEDFGFPIELSAKALADESYYCFISDGFQEMCKSADIYPCLMDAAIFSSFDGEDAWTEEHFNN